MEEKEIKYFPMKADDQQAKILKKVRRWNLKHRRISERRRGK